MLTLKKLFLVHLVTGFLFIIFYQNHFNYSPRIIFLHLLLLTVILGVLNLPLILVKNINHSRVISLYILSIFPLFDFLLILLYSANYISNSFWSGNVTIQLISAYVSDFENTIKSIPGVLLYVVLAFILLLVFTFFYLFTLQKRRIRLLTNQTERKKILSYLTTLIVITPILLHISFERQDPGIWNGEPFSNLFLDFIPMFKVDGTENRQSNILISSSNNKDFAHKNIIIILVDALRSDHLKYYGYTRDTSPFISDLIEQGKLKKVETVHSTCSESVCGILSTLSGQDFENIKLNSIHIGEILKNNGYKSHFILAGNHAWAGIENFYNADFFSDGRNRENFSLNDDAGVLHDFRELDIDKDKASFFYFHLYSVHGLGLRHNQFNIYKPYESSINPFSLLFSSEDTKRELAINNYDNGIIQADFFIKNIFFELKKRGILDNSIIIITADHGEALGEHDHYGHYKYLYEEDTRIPLLIFDTSDVQYQNLKYATQLDILPTILDRLKINIPENYKGKSLLLPAPENSKTFHRTPLEDGWKMTLFKEGDGLYKHLWKGKSYHTKTDEKLFEISSDKKELNNLINTPSGEIILNKIR